MNSGPAAISVKAKAAAKADIATRVVAVLVCLACACVIATAIWVLPAADGHGSHTQLGLPPCMWAVVLHRPCPTCGMTTSFAYAVRGRLIDAAVTQPFGLLIALGTGVTFWASLYIALTGSQLGGLVGRAMGPRALWSLAALAAAAWAYKWATWPTP
jgi:hypothetical protein